MRSELRDIMLAAVAEQFAHEAWARHNEMVEAGDAQNPKTIEEAFKLGVMHALTIVSCSVDQIKANEKKAKLN